MKAKQKHKKTAIRSSETAPACLDVLQKVMYSTNKSFLQEQNFQIFFAFSVFSIQ